MTICIVMIQHTLNFLTSFHDDKEVYNSVSYSHENMSALLQKFENIIDEECKSCDHKHNVTVLDVTKSISTVKTYKYDGFEGHYTDHMINGSDMLLVHLSCLFTSIILHGYKSGAMLVSTIVPMEMKLNQTSH